MIGSFWRARRLWSSVAEVEDSTECEVPTDRRRAPGDKSSLVDLSSLGDEIVFRREPRTPGPGAAWSGGRL